MNIAHYAKSIVYIALAVAAVLVTALADNFVSQPELVNLGIVGVGAIGVYWAKNVPGTALATFKGVVAFVVAALVALNSLLSGGVSPAEWMQIFIAAFAGIGVSIIPNEPAKSLSSTN